MRDAIDAGLRPTNHTDFVVAPLDQMMMLWSAVNRVSRAGREVGSGQRVTPFEGLKTMTAWAAEEYGEEASKGTLEAGKLADLVILDGNPVKVDPMAIRDIRVVETIKEGRTIFPAPAGWFPATKAPSDAAATYAWSIEACDIAAVNTAANRTWTLTRLDDGPVEAAAPPTMLFSRGRLSVFGGVNRISGSYALVNDAVVMGELVSTRKAGPPELMALEDRFIKVLAGVNGFTVAGNRLTLRRDGKDVAEFR